MRINTFGTTVKPRYHPYLPHKRPLVTLNAGHSDGLVIIRRLIGCPLQKAH